VVRVIWDEFGKWYLVGRFAANAKTSITSTFGTVRGLSTSTSQSQTTEFSADWGNYYPAEVRVMGATDFDNWRNTRTVDFVYGVPTGRKWMHFFSNGNSTGMTHYGTDTDLGTSYGGSFTSRRWGFTTTYAYDGKGRWNNPTFVWYRMSDANVTNPAAAYTTPTASAINWHTGNDAKLGVHAYRKSAGQDVESCQEFGEDDAQACFFDNGHTHLGQGSTTSTYSSAVWILIKAPCGYGRGS
jgi:hypothetical protein